MADLPFELKAKHIEGSRRGELLLDSDELNNLNQYLTTKGGWRFAAVPEASRKLTLYRSFAKPSRFSSSGKQATKPAEKLPDWVTTLSRLLTTFSQLDKARPFADKLPHVTEPLEIGTHPTAPNSELHLTRRSAGAQLQKEIQSAIQPYCSSIPLKQIIYKLEAGQYTSSLEAFNDVYGFFLSGFRHYPPGSPHWMLMYQLTSSFFNTLSAYPLQDNFEGPPSILQTAPQNPNSRIPKAPKHHKKKAKIPTENGEQVKRVRGSSAATSASGQKLKFREKRTFERMLATLPVDLHPQFFALFKNEAVWKQHGAPSTDAGAEPDQVEVDEEQTPIEVIHRMTEWCAARVVASRKRTRVAADDVSAQTEESAAVATPVPETESMAVDTRYAWLSSDEEKMSSRRSSTSSSSSSSDDDGESTGN